MNPIKIISTGIIFLLAEPLFGQSQLLSFQGFDDAIHHYQNKNGKAYARYEKANYLAIADNLLLYQKDNGGWIENQDPQRILSDKEKEEFRKQKSNLRISFDNRNTYSQVEYLYAAYRESKQSRYREAALKGLDLILALQDSLCGLWPHTVPASESYHSHLTIADEVSSGVLTLLLRIEQGKAPFEDLDETTRRRATNARKKGNACLLRLQVKQKGTLSIWAGQYDAKTLAPAQGRSFELPSLASWESVALVRYLMQWENPSPEAKAAIEAAITWFKQHKIEGYRLLEVPLTEDQKFEFHKANFDRKLIHDEKAPALWARFYDLDSNTVVLANRDGKRVQRYDQIDIERRTGYQWYGDWPRELIGVEYPAWRKRVY